MTEKEKGAVPFESAPQGETTAADSTTDTSRALFHPLTWRPEKPARFRGKSKRRTRADAIARKRGYGRIDAALAGWLLLLVVVLLALIGEVAR